MKPDEYKKLLEKPKISKYSAIKTVYSGKTYDSKLEARYAQFIERMIKKGEAVSVEPQYTLRLEVNGELICKYIPDFMITFTDGHIEMWDAKGMETKDFKIKWKLAKVLYPQYDFKIKK